MAAMRDRKRKAGLKPMDIWAHPDDHQAIRDYAATLAKARDLAANDQLEGTPKAFPLEAHVGREED